MYNERARYRERVKLRQGDEEMDRRMERGVYSERQTDRQVRTESRSGNNISPYYREQMDVEERTRGKKVKRKI